MMLNGLNFERLIIARMNASMSPMTTANMLTPTVYGAPFMAVVKPNHNLLKNSIIKVLSFHESDAGMKAGADKLTIYYITVG